MFLFVFRNSIPVDYILYRKFWSLQDFFRRPAQCYDKVAWKLFTNVSNSPISVYHSCTLVRCRLVSVKKCIKRIWTHHSYSSFLFVVFIELGLLTTDISGID